MQHSPLRTRSLVEGALMVAMGTVLSVIPFIELPHGGSITWVSSLPLIVMAFRWNLPRALGTAFVASLIQLFMGIKNLAYCQTLTAQAGCVLLDYLLACVILFSICFSVVLFFVRRKHYTLEPGPLPFSRAEKAHACFTSPWVWILLVGGLAYSGVSIFL